MTHRSSVFFLVSTISLLSFSGTLAAPITWGTPTGTSGKEGRIGGTAVAALNGGDTGPATTDGGASGTGGSDGYGQSVIGTSVAEDTTQALQLGPGGAGFGQSRPNTILAVEGNGVTDEFVITRVSFDPGSEEVSLTWTSEPGESYLIQWSPDLAGFASTTAGSTSASAGETTTAVFDRTIELIGQPDVYFRAALPG